MVEQALHLGRALVGDPASTGVMVHGDLHDYNVLAAARRPWLVIDPKPMSGDPHYEPAPLLWNRWEEIADGDARAAVRRRFHAVVDAAGLDEERARDWVVVRMVHQRALDHPGRAADQPPARAGRARLDHPVHRHRQGRAGLSGRRRVRRAPTGSPTLSA